MLLVEDWFLAIRDLRPPLGDTGGFYSLPLQSYHYHPANKKRVKI